MSYPKTKTCGFGCGTEIYWSVEDNAYFEVDTDQRHQCPKYVRGGIPKKETTWQPRTKPDYSSKPKEKENGSKNVDNSLTYIVGDLVYLRLQYELISSLVSTAGGKIHGSQRGTDQEGNIDLIVYWEVPKGYAANIHESFKQQRQRSASL